MELDMRTLLPKVRAAFDAGQLQAQSEPSEIVGMPRCRYSGPCAIGVGMTTEEAENLDHRIGDKAIGVLIADGVIVVPRGQKTDFVYLQSTHDGWVEGSWGDVEFLSNLTRLEAKYAS